MNEFVCGECFGDKGMRDFCLNHAESNNCDFCGATSDEPIAAPLDEVIGHIRACVFAHFDDPANAGLAYESREGGYQGTTYDTQEVFDELGLEFPKDKNDRLYNAVAQGMENDLWCETDPYGLSPDQQHAYSWEQFCRVIKHEKRYFFFQQEKKRGPLFERDELLSPAETLRTIFDYAKEANAFVRLSKGTKFYRARFQAPGRDYKTAGSLGPPPVEQAIQTNRMSPPGVVMTYASEDLDTALAETASGPGTFAVGTFVNERDLLILDLTKLPDVPSVFAELSDSLEYDPRPRLKFLHSVTFSISRPIARDDRVHIEYVPTQVITEYLRTVVRIDRRKVDGIRYPSSRRHVASAIVLFADQRNLMLEQNEQPTLYFTDNRWLRLVKARTIEVSTKDITKWKRKGFLPDDTV